MRKIFSILFLLGCAVTLSLGFISDGGGYSGSAVNALHADNIDNAGGTNVFISKLTVYDEMRFSDRSTDETIADFTSRYLSRVSGGHLWQSVNWQECRLKTTPATGYTTTLDWHYRQLFGQWATENLSLRDALNNEGATIAGVTSPVMGSLIRVGVDQVFSISQHLDLPNGVAFASVDDAYGANMGMEFRGSEIKFSSFGSGVSINENPDGVHALNVGGSIKASRIVLGSEQGAEEGEIYYDTSTHHFYGYDGTTWKQLDN